MSFPPDVEEAIEQLLDQRDKRGAFPGPGPRRRSDQRMTLREINSTLFHRFGWTPTPDTLRRRIRQREQRKQPPS